MKFVEGSSVNSGEVAYTRKEAKRLFLKSAKAAKKPFIYLSAGVTNAEFTESLALAGESGVRFSGVLCGRATWKDGIPIYAKQGAKAFRHWLSTQGVENIKNVNAALEPASSWYGFYGASSPDELRADAGSAPPAPKPVVAKPAPKVAMKPATNAAPKKVVSTKRGRR